MERGIRVSNLRPLNYLLIYKDDLTDLDVYPQTQQYIS